MSLSGFMGVIFGPLMLAIFILCVNMFKREYLDRKRTAKNSSAAYRITRQAMTPFTSFN